MSTPILLNPSNRQIADGRTPYKAELSGQELLYAILLLGFAVTSVVALGMTFGPALLRLLSGSVGTNELVSLVLAVVGMVCFGAVPLWFAWMFGQRWWHEIRLQRAGRVLVGEVLSYSSTSDSEGNVQINLQYRFTAPDGRVFEGRRGGVCNTLKGRRPLAPGDGVVVWYAGPRAFRLL